MAHYHRLYVAHAIFEPAIQPDSQCRHGHQYPTAYLQCAAHLSLFPANQQTGSAHYLSHSVCDLARFRLLSLLFFSYLDKLTSPKRHLMPAEGESPEG